VVTCDVFDKEISSDAICVFITILIFINIFMIVYGLIIVSQNLNEEGS